MIQGLTLSNLCMKPSSSTTRSRTTGKLASGSITIRSPKSLIDVLQVSLGSPFTIIPQEPQTAMRHDQRCDTVASISSLMKFTASRTFQFSSHGTLYSCCLGTSSLSGSKRVMTIVFSFVAGAISIFAPRAPRYPEPRPSCRVGDPPDHGTPWCDRGSSRRLAWCSPCTCVRRETPCDAPRRQRGSHTAPDPHRR